MSGAFLHEIIYFYLGRWKGREFLLRNNYTRKQFRRVKNLFDKYGVLSIFIIRFWYGMRIIPMVLMGATGFSVGKFIFFNIISLFFWAVIYLSIGYMFGKAAETFFKEAKEYYFIAAGILLLIISFILLLPKIREKFFNNTNSSSSA